MIGVSFLIYTPNGKKISYFIVGRPETDSGLFYGAFVLKYANPSNQLDFLLHGSVVI